MARQDDSDSGFQPKKSNSKKDRQQQQPAIGEADPNSRAAQWLRDAAKKPSVEKVEKPTLSPIQDETSDGVGSIGQYIDSVFQDLFDYVGQLEATLLETYKTVETMQKKLEDFDQLEKDFRTLQTIVLAIQSSQRYNFNCTANSNDFNVVPQPPFNPITLDPNVVIPSRTGSGVESPFDNPPRMRKDEMDKE